MLSNVDATRECKTIAGTLPWEYSGMPAAYTSSLTVRGEP